jgi:hypothetical protein
MSALMNKSGWPLLQSAAFDPEKVDFMQKCLDQAWRVAASRRDFMERDQQTLDVERSRLASAILEGATRGKWHPADLVEFALRSISGNRRVDGTRANP